jgi:hypothetical protein
MSGRIQKLASDAARKIAAEYGIDEPEDCATPSPLRAAWYAGYTTGKRAAKTVKSDTVVNPKIAQDSATN